MKRIWLGALLLCAAACAANAQVVDTTVCAVLKDPAGFNGKTVRIKGTVVSSFDQFVISDGDCGHDVNGIWLAYPQGTKAKSGPVAMLVLAPAHNFAGTAPAPRPAVTLTRDKPFKQFDSLLAQKHDSSGALCLGCSRYQVQATLVGRLDGVADVTLPRDSKGKITGLGGFGNLNAYPARLVLESVADVTPKEIDYSASDAIVKKAGGNESDPNQGNLEPIATAQTLTERMAGNPIATQMQADIALLPRKKQQGDVNIVYGAVNEVSASEGAPAAQDTADGLVYTCALNSDRLPGLALPMALMHLAQHIADIRAPQTGDENAPLYIFENNAWAVTATIAVAGGEKFLILPGGYIMWNSAWPSGDRIANMTTAMDDFLGKEELLSK